MEKLMHLMLKQHQRCQKVHRWPNDLPWDSLSWWLQSKQLPWPSPASCGQAPAGRQTSAQQRKRDSTQKYVYTAMYSSSPAVCHCAHCCISRQPHTPHLQGLEEPKPNNGSELLESHTDGNVRGGDVLVLGLFIWVLEHGELREQGVRGTGWCVCGVCMRVLTFTAIKVSCGLTFRMMSSYRALEVRSATYRSPRLQQ